MSSCEFALLTWDVDNKSWIRIILHQRFQRYSSRPVSCAIISTMRCSTCMHALWLSLLHKQ